MKKNYMIYGIAALTCLLAAACAKVETAEPAQEEETLTENVVVFKATASEDDTKAEITLADGDFSWTATSDKIAVATDEGYKISTGATGVSGNKADFSVSLGTATLNTNAFALYPHTLVWDDDAEPAAARTDCNPSHDGDGDNLVVYLPDSYPIGDVTSPKVPCPMIASIVVDGEGALGNLSFKQLCAVLCIQVNSIPASANTLVLDFNGKKVSGKFEVEALVVPGSSSIVAAEGSDDTITITGLDYDDWKDNLVINIPVPTGVVSTNEFTNLTVTAKNGATTVLEMTRPIKVGANWVPQRAMRRKIVASLPAFSVSPTKRVAISRSNLQCTTTDGWTTWTWSFMDYPWSVVETSTLTADDYADATAIGLFCWGTSGHLFDAKDNYGTKYKPFFTTGSNSDYGPDRIKTENSGLIGEKYKYGDWGVEAGSLEGYSNWRTPTGDEYLYLFALKGYNLNGYSSGTTFDNDAALAKSDNEPVANDYRYSRRLNNFGLGMVNGKKGMIVLPDYFVDPSGKFVVRYTKDNEGDFLKNLYTEGEWTTMAQAGAVFLPIAGVRSGKTVNSPDGYGRYWSVTPHPTADEVRQMTFHYKSLRVVTEVRNSGRSVRLIRDIE